MPTCSHFHGCNVRSVSGRGRCNVGWSKDGRKIRGQTWVVDILVDNNRKVSTWYGRMMCKTDNCWWIRVMEWSPRNGKCSQGWQRARWSDETKKFARIKWEELTQGGKWVLGYLVNMFDWARWWCMIVWNRSALRGRGQDRQRQTGSLSVLFAFAWCALIANNLGYRNEHFFFSKKIRAKVGVCLLCGANYMKTFSGWAKNVVM